MRTYVLGLIAAAALTVGGCPAPTTGGTNASTNSGATGGASTTTGTSGSTTTTTTGTLGGSTTTAGGDDAHRVLELVNDERTSRGLSTLTRNTLLDAAAAGHASDMRAGGFFSHTGRDGGSVGDRATAAGYVWSRVGENIGSGQTTPEQVMDGWMNSDGHRANILEPNFTELGVGIDENGSTLWVQVFGTRR